MCEWISHLHDHSSEMQKTHFWSAHMLTSVRDALTVWMPLNQQQDSLVKVNDNLMQK